MKVARIERIASEYNLQYLKKYHSLIGKVEDYPIVISGLHIGGICTIRIVAMIDPNEEAICEWKKQFSSISKVQGQEGIFEVILKRHCTSDKKEATIIQTLQYISHYVKEHPVDTYCAHCGMKHVVRPYGIYDRIVLMCDTCYEKLQKSIEEVDHVEEVPYDKLGKGILGALGGAIIGIVFWCLAYQMGFYAPITGFVLAFCVWKGYTLFSKRISKFAVGIAILIMASAILLSQVLCLSLSIYHLLKADYTFTFAKAVQSVGQYLQMSNIRNSFIRDLFVGYLITTFASYTIFLLQKKHKEQSMVEIDCLENIECDLIDDK